MNKQTRYWVRRILFFVMVVIIGVALYQAIQQGKSEVPQAGDKAPDFQLTTLDGKEMKLSQLRGKAVMLNFWGTWCKPCRTEMPAMQQMYEKYKGSGFEIVAVNIAETDVAAASFARQYSLTFPIWMDRNRDVVNLYGIKPIPSSFFIDPQGVIRKKIEGQLNVNQLEVYINSVLPQK
ncbi:thiol-disulfide oxidoreductase ResA [Paenactinomyces guangxiensis]|uniref:Thiol-disulfide oxidoreductase ResA n=1 Tax=Paenactinomyces guangxiensis TaxID=1490290 RepID=A0A7W1WR02_9BACL|nr:thiol-disulfide oxidoreductase ResA [Paenactinomyces guangxiensis]MBA4494276.1 thiol-disulfide oxidoreductase ResA [Paenactinomyces guangxiensis]MBH8590770.1 thiol-disulfide oxidoreductase ResA [Paenactinomyces guangxiensis]